MPERELARKEESGDQDLPRVPGEILRAELNIAKFSSFLFAPSHTPKEKRMRVKTWSATNPETGEPMRARIAVYTVGNHQTLTTYDQKTFLALQKLWWDQHPTDTRQRTAFSLRQLAVAMGLTWGKELRKQLKDSLRRLRQVPTEWKFAWFDKRSGKAIATERTKNLIADLLLIDRYDVAGIKDPLLAALNDKNPTAQGPLCSFLLDEETARNLLENGVKPIFLNVALHIRSEIALKLYSHLDIVLATKTVWQCGLEKLFGQELGIAGLYRWPSDRLRLLKHAVKELEGKPISTGVLTFSFGKNKTGADKLMVRKMAFRKQGIVSGGAGFRKPGLPRQRRRALTDIEQSLVDDLVDRLADEHSRRAWELVVAQGDIPPDMLRGFASEASYAHRMGRIKGNRGSFTMDLVNRYRAEKATASATLVNHLPSQSSLPSQSPSSGGGGGKPLDGVTRPVPPPAPNPAA